MSESRLREQMATLARSMFERGLTFGSSGNISVAVDDGYLITPTHSCLGFLDPTRISKLDNSGRHIGGDAPSKEVFLHRALYETRTSARAIVHLHATYSTAISCLEGTDPDDPIPPITPYGVMRVGRVKMLPYVRPGDPAAGELIRSLGGRHAAVLLANHGPVVAARDLQAAVYATEELEETAKLVMLLRGQRVRCLTHQQVEDLERTFSAQHS